MQVSNAVTINVISWKVREHKPTRKAVTHLALHVRMYDTGARNEIRVPQFCAQQVTWIKSNPDLRLQHPATTLHFDPGYFTVA